MSEERPSGAAPKQDSPKNPSGPVGAKPAPAASDGSAMEGTLGRNGFVVERQTSRVIADAADPLVNPEEPGGGADLSPGSDAKTASWSSGWSGGDEDRSDIATSEVDVDTSSYLEDFEELLSSEVTVDVDAMRTAACRGISHKVLTPATLHSPETRPLL